KPSAQPFTQTPRRARRSQVFSPLAQTSCESEMEASSGRASALAIHSGEFGIVAGIWSRLNQSESAGFSGHNKSRAIRAGLGREAVRRYSFNARPSSVRPRRKVI